MACGPASIHTDNSPTFNDSSESASETRNESCTKSRIAVSMPDTMSASWTPAAPACACCSSNPVRRSIRKTCSTRNSSVFDSTTSAKASPARSASIRHCTDRHDTACSSVRLSDSTMPRKPAATALRIAGPITGKSASASGLGLRCTDVVIACSSGGVSARVKWDRAVPEQDLRKDGADVFGARLRIVEPRLQRGQPAPLGPHQDRPQRRNLFVRVGIARSGPRLVVLRRRDAITHADHCRRRGCSARW